MLPGKRRNHGQQNLAEVLQPEIGVVCRMAGIQSRSRSFFGGSHFDRLDIGKWNPRVAAGDERLQMWRRCADRHLRDLGKLRAIPLPRGRCDVPSRAEFIFSETSPAGFSPHAGQHDRASPRRPPPCSYPTSTSSCLPARSYSPAKQSSSNKKVRRLVSSGCFFNSSPSASIAGLQLAGTVKRKRVHERVALRELVFLRVVSDRARCS